MAADEQRVLNLSDWQANIGRSSNLFWFVHISDTHIGTPATYEKDKQQWLAKENEVVALCNEVIQPALAVVTGDLVTLPDEDSFRMYRAWRDLWKCPVLDVPGNHDGSPVDALFAKNVGARRCAVVAGPCRFVGFDTGPFSPYAAADIAPTMRWLDEMLTAEPRHLPVMFGHFPLHSPPRTALNKPIENFQIIGENAERLTSLMRRHRVALYLSGHTHDPNETGDAISGTWHVVGDSLADGGGRFRVFCVDGETISYSTATPGKWPLIVITSPRRHLDNDTKRLTDPIRVEAKVFSPVAIKQVTFSVDAQSEQHPMMFGERGLWTAQWDSRTKPRTIASHTIIVTATDVRGRKTTEKIIGVFGGWDGMKTTPKIFEK